MARSGLAERPLPPAARRGSPSSSSSSPSADVARRSLSASAATLAAWPGLRIALGAPAFGAAWPWLVRPRGLAAGLASASALGFGLGRDRVPAHVAWAASPAWRGCGASASVGVGVGASASARRGASAPADLGGLLRPCGRRRVLAWLPRTGSASASGGFVGDPASTIGDSSARRCLGLRGLRCDDRGHDRHGDRGDCGRRLRRCLALGPRRARRSLGSSVVSRLADLPRPGAARRVRPRHLRHGDRGRVRHGGGGGAGAPSPSPSLTTAPFGVTASFACAARSSSSSSSISSSSS